jgi:hypothetical protein
MEIQIKQTREERLSNEELQTQVERAKEKHPLHIFSNRLTNPNIRRQILETMRKFGKNMSDEKFNKKLDEVLGEVNSLTKIDFSKHAKDSSFHLKDKESTIGLLLDKKMITAHELKSHVEAHEKDHNVRDAFMTVQEAKVHGLSEYLMTRFKKRLTTKEIIKTGVIAFTVNTLLWGSMTSYFFGYTIGAIVSSIGGAGSTISMVNSVDNKNGYLDDFYEMTARMAQLKNYFGFEADEVFTKEHLQYAKSNYIKDVIDNSMAEFFALITSENESDFLEIMNSWGI